MPTDETITDLTIESTPVEFQAATLHRSQSRLPSGLPGSPEWELEVVGGDLPDASSDDVRVELTIAGASYHGAGRLVSDAGRDGGRSLIEGNGPLISYTLPR